MSGRFYLRYATRSLRRGGQRTLLAAICITFGVMALVSMQLLASSITGSLLIEPRRVLGGDALLTWPAGGVGPAQIAQLERLRADGAIQRYTLQAAGEAGIMKAKGSPKAISSDGVLGIDPTSFPLIGAVELREPAGQTVAQVLLAPGDVIVTRAVADTYGVQVGDELVFGRHDGRPPMLFHIRGVAQRVPNNLAGTIYYNLATARLLDGEAAVGQAAILWGTHGPQPDQLKAAGWQVQLAGRPEDQQVNTVFDLMLKGAGMLGLVVGGIGVANTMQVMLARRRNEIAALTTLGYRQRDLLALFGLEIVLLGIGGSLAGALIAVGLSTQLVHLLESTGSFLLEPIFSPAIIGGGLLTGVMTTLIFGAVAIVRASAVRPAVLLRDLPVAPARRIRAAMAGLYGGLGLVFAALASLIMGGVESGIAVVLLALVGLLVLGAIFAGLLTLMTWLPLPGRLTRMARINLRRDRRRSAIALIALFIGIFTIGFSTATISSARARVAEREAKDPPQKLWIQASAEEAPQIAEQLSRLGIAAPAPTLQAQVHAILPSAAVAPEPWRLDGRADSPPFRDVAVLEGGLGEAPDSVLLSARLADAYALAIGSQLRLRGPGGAIIVRVTGIYEPQGNAGMADLIGHANLMQPFDATQRAVSAVITLPADQLQPVTDALNRALPTALIYNQSELNAFLLGLLSSLLSFVVAVAGLSCVAGGVLIANTVGLAMVERRRELGILKAVGYPSRTVLALIVLENAFLGLLAGSMGTLAVAAAIVIVNQRVPGAQLALTPGTTMPMIGLAVGLAMVCALAVAWQPTHQRPLEVLRAD